MARSLWWVSACPALVLLASASVLFAGPKGTVQVRRVPEGAISIDGQFADWQLDGYTGPARQPLFPQARDALVTNAIGDHILFELDRVGYFNGTPDCVAGPCGFTNQAPIDFGSAIYLAFDTRALYVLGVFIDDVLEGSRDITEFGDNNFLNDGFEIFIDALNDSDDIADELNNPPNRNFDDDQPGVTPNLDDFQITLGLNENFPSPPGAGSMGARQHLERSGRPELLGGEGPDQPWLDFFEVIAGQRNGPGGLYRDALTAFGTDIAARSYEDLRAAGARNPEISAHPGVTFPGYVIEAAIPFAFADLDGDGDVGDDFVPAHDMGFALFWRDTDEEGEPDTGGANIAWADWTQNTDVPGSEGPNGEPVGLFHTGNWARLVFATLPGDFNGDMELTAADIDLLSQAVRSDQTNARFDLTGDGTVDQDDRADWVRNRKKTWFGDANLDGQFNSADFVAVFQIGEYEDPVPGNSTWAEGDWNGDADFNSGDFVIAFQDGGFEQGPRGAMSSAPEPSGWLMVCAFFAPLARRRSGNVLCGLRSVTVRRLPAG